MKRREFIAATSTAFLAACIDGSGPRAIDSSSDHLLARPGVPSGNPPTGLRALGLGEDRDGFIYASPSYSASTPASLIILLHGAGRSSNDWTSIDLEQIFGSRNVVVVAPDSRRASWDLRLTGFGPDVAFIDKALQLAFSQYVVKSSSIALAGFSDGASYALSLGASNGDLFNAAMAFSPGFYQPGTIRGRPKIFVSHGTADTVLPFSWTSQQLVPSLSSSGYDVKFVQFDGGHGIPLTVLNESISWWLS